MQYDRRLSASDRDDTSAATVVKWTASLPTLQRVEQVIGGIENGAASPAKVRAGVKAEIPSKN